MTKSIAQWQEHVYNVAKEKGFHSKDKETDYSNMGNYLCNLHSEVSELWEAHRENRLNKLCDKADKMRTLGLLQLTAAEEELADIVIRAMDTAQSYGIDLEAAMEAKSAYNETREFRHGNKLA